MSSQTLVERLGRVNASLEEHALEQLVQITHDSTRKELFMQLGNPLLELLNDALLAQNTDVINGVLVAFTNLYVAAKRYDAVSPSLTLVHLVSQKVLNASYEQRGGFSGIVNRLISFGRLSAIEKLQDAIIRFELARMDPQSVDSTKIMPIIMKMMSIKEQLYAAHTSIWLNGRSVSIEDMRAWQGDLQSQGSQLRAIVVTLAKDDYKREVIGRLFVDIVMIECDISSLPIN